MSDDKGMSPLLHDYHVRVLLPCYRETPEMVRSGTCKAPPVMRLCPAYVLVGSETVSAPRSAKAPLKCTLLPQIRTTAQAVLAAHLPPGCRRTVYVCDDGKDPVKRVSDSRCATSSLRLSAHERMLSELQTNMKRLCPPAGLLTCTFDTHIKFACCLQAWVSELGRIDLQYIADRIRTPGEVNGKSANLNNALNHIFPPGTAIGFNEVLQPSSSI